MDSPKRTYFNAGVQTAQGRLEALKFHDADDSAFFTVKGISLVLGINRNAVTQIPVKRYMIDKRGYYRKGEILDWMEADLQMPDSLLRQLADQQQRARDRKIKHKSRVYISGQNTLDAKELRAKSKESVKQHQELTDRTGWFKYDVVPKSR